MTRFVRPRVPALAAVSLLLAFAGTGCQGLLPPAAAPPVESEPPISPEVYRRADRERSERLESEVRRLRADLAQAEQVLVSIESGLRGRHSRAEAASSLAEARIQVERASQRAPWRQDELREAQRRLDDADGHIRDQNYGAAVFFVFSAQRIASQLEDEAAQIDRSPTSVRVRAKRVNLRSGPSTQRDVVAVLTAGTPVFAEGGDGDWTLVRTTRGEIGWVHAPLLARP